MADKRKRQEPAAGARKKANVQQQQQQQQQQQPPQIIKVASVRVARSCPPVIATTPGIALDRAVNFQAFTKPGPAQKNSKKTPVPTLLLHSSEHPRVDYTAKEDGLDGLESHLKHYIGVFDPETGKLDVIEAKKMSVRGVPRAQKAAEDTLAGRSAPKTISEQRNDLGMEFGTKKAKKALLSQTENAIAPIKPAPDASPSKLTSSSLALMDTIGEVTQGMATREQLQAAVDQSKPVPPGNYDATAIYDVYTPEALIGAEVLSAIPIKDWQDIEKQGSGFSIETKQISHSFWKVARGEHKVRNLRVLRYLHCLLLIHKNLKKGGRDRGSWRLPDRQKLQELLDPMPAHVIESIKRKFTTNGELRKRQTDLLKTYCITLVFIVNHFDDYETEHLRYDLGLDESDFKKYAREIGGDAISKPIKEGKGKCQMAKLALPLKFPEVRMARSRRA